MSNCPTSPCVMCGKPVHTCDDVRCHPGGCQLRNGDWVCSLKCWDAACRDAEDAQLAGERLRTARATFKPEDGRGASEIMTDSRIAQLNKAEIKLDELRALLTEWLETPFFDDPVEWETWRDQFRPRVIDALEIPPPCALSGQGKQEGES